MICQSRRMGVELGWNVCIIRMYQLHVAKRTVYGKWRAHNDMDGEYNEYKEEETDVKGK
jgi:hypothetical protein